MLISVPILAYLFVALNFRRHIFFTLQKPAHIESESSFNTLVGLLSNAKQDLCTLEMEAVNSYNQMSGYANIDPLAIKTGSRATHLSKPRIPPAEFEVRMQQYRLD